MSLLIILITLYVVFLIGISYYYSKKNTDEDFLIAGRNRGKYQIMFSKFATTVGISWFIVFGAYSYEFGFSMISVCVGLLISFIVFALWATPKIYESSKEHKFYTQGDFVSFKTKNDLDKKIIDIISILSVFLGILIAIIGGSKVLEHLNILSYEYSLVFILLLVLIYILLSGFKAVVITDIIQSLIILVVITFILFFLFFEVNIQKLFIAEQKPLEISFLIAFLLYSFLNLFSTPDRYQYVFSAKSKTDAKNGLLLSTLPVILVTFAILISGIYTYNIDKNLNPDLAFVTFFFDFLPESLFIIGALLLITSLMSSCDTWIYNIASYLAFLNPNKKSNKIHDIRIYTIFIVLLIGIIGYYVRDIISAGLFSASFFMVAPIAMIYIIAGGLSSRKFKSLIFFGLLGFFLGLLIIGIGPELLIFPVLFSCLGFLIRDKKIYKSSS